ncbi:putative bifunctional diguanylate cyclase/phosphodiesterase [Thiohalorhabdus sp. Cl-TMA]|uniref:Bifunctional diguanylate cyclase/phosphodiesterase n=1 Tax=Thiohalorhabdus methylotrophus TaxID=3242694 RepID=A0ABV4TS80_9GAMM
MSTRLPIQLAGALVERLPDPVVTVDPAGRIQAINPAAGRCFGWQPEEAAGQPLELLLPVAPEILGLDGEESAPEPDLPLTLRAQSRTGRPFLITLTGLIRDGLTALLLSPPAAPADHAEGRHRLLGQALEQLGDMVWITDRRGRIEYVNPAFERVTGYTASEAVGQPNAEILGADYEDDAFYRRLSTALEAGRAFRDVFTNRTRWGELVYLDETITPVLEPDGSISRFVATARDITRRLALEERLQRMAFHDPLTGLANRDLLLNRADRAIIRARHDQQAVALVLVDLRQFRDINQSLGHAIGDEVLKAVGERLQEGLSESDTAARVGSDRYLLLLEGLHSSRWACRITQRLLGRLEEPLEVADQEFFLGAWCGVGVYPEDGDDAASVLSRAETALGRARSERVRGPVFFSPERDEQAQHRHALEVELHRALEQDQLHLCYQPQYRLSDGVLVGVETLLRWRHPRLGPVSPAEFIPLLEDTGLIHPVGDWVLRTACAQMARWRQEGLTGVDLAVNLSPEQFRHPRLLARIQQILEETGMAEERLELEVTESLLIENPPDVLRNLQVLRGMGITMALDDFGTGYSALSYLQDFPIDVLKLDRSLTDGLERNLARSPGLIRGVIELAQSLGMAVVAEGIESNAQLQFLQSLACERGQGFGLERPRPPEAIPALAGAAPPGGAF